MASKDLHTRIKTITALPVTLIAFEGITPGASLDTSEGFRSVEFLMFAESVSTGTWTLIIQDSANNSVFTEVPQDFLLGTEADTAVMFGVLSAVRTLGYIGHKRFVRPALRSVGGAPVAEIALITLVSNATRPPINPNASTP